MKFVRMDMKNFIYAERVSEGKCGIDYRGKDVQADIEWDNNVLPYLGFWITAGGFRGDYNCAWEPSSGYYDSVSRALRNNAYGSCSLRRKNSLT